jgi:hypothetical protein
LSYGTGTTPLTTTTTTTTTKSFEYKHPNLIPAKRQKEVILNDICREGGSHLTPKQSRLKNKTKCIKINIKT